MSDRRETMMLANVWKHQPVDGWFCSMKLDGVRAWYDGGITRGLPIREVPWANVRKHDRYVNKEQVATGLWSRYYQPIHAPDWWLDRLPPFPLDGELYLGAGCFQKTMSVVRRLMDNVNGEGWKNVVYCIFDIPALADVLKPGKINTPLMENYNIESEVYDWAIERLRKVGLAGKRPKINRYYEFVNFVRSDEWKSIEELGKGNVLALGQRELRKSEDIELLLEQATKKGLEGLMLRNPNSVWEPKRVKSLLKVKTTLDSEGIVVGYIGGKDTDKGGKLLGLMGALLVKWKGKTFELGTGFTEEERVLVEKKKKWLHANYIVKQFAGLVVPEELVTSVIFPIGGLVRFKFQDLSTDGIPRFARYYR